MFLIERAISLLCFAFALLFNCYLISRVKDKQYKIILFAYLLILCFFAWGFEPHVTSDLYRIREYIQYWVDLSVDGLFEYASTRADPVWVIFSYYTNFLGNINWMQTISCFLGMSSLFIVVSGIIERFDIKRNNRGWILFYAMCSGAAFIGLISGIRSPLGTMIVIYCVYKEYFDNRNILVNIPLYFIAAGLHSFSMLLVMIRLLFLGFQGRSIFSKLFSVFLSILLLLVVFYYGQFYIQSGLDKSNSYINNTDEYVYFWSGCISLLIIAMNIFISYKWWTLFQNNEWKRYKTYVVYSLLCTLGSLCFFPFSFAVFVRLTMFSFYLAMPAFAMILKYGELYPNYLWTCRFIKFYMCVLCIISFLRGDICGYKFFVL